MTRMFPSTLSSRDTVGVLENDLRMDMDKEVNELGFIQTTLDPVHYDVLPPNITTRTTFAKRFTVDGEWTILDPADLVIEKVPSDTGLVVWLVQRGILSIYRMGIVQKGTISYAGNMTYGGIPLVYSAELAVPYNVGNNQQITIAPSPTRDFTFTRLAAGVVSIRSTDVPIGSTAFIGNISAGSIQDWRDVCQNSQGLAFSTADIKQQSVTTKDAFVKESLEEGCTFIVGSDVPNDFSVPDRDNYGSFNAGYETLTVLNSISDSSQPWALCWGTFGKNLVVTHQWVTPWKTNVNSTSSVPYQWPSSAVDTWEYSNFLRTDGNVLQNQNVGQINPCGFAGFDITVGFNRLGLKNSDTPITGDVFPSLAGQMITLTYTTTINVVDVYASCNLGGYLSYSSWSSGNIAGQAAYGSNYTFTDPYQFYVDPTSHKVSYITPASSGSVSHTVSHRDQGHGLEQYGSRGQYIGSMVTVYQNVAASVTLGTTVSGTYNGVSLLNYANAPGAVTPPETFWSSQFNLLQITAVAQDIYTQGELGPLRVCRYDQVGKGQTMVVDGTLLVECVPEGTIAPYVVPSLKSTGITSNVNLFIVIAALYNGGGPFKRIWRRNDYLRVLHHVVPTLTIETLLNWASEYPDVGAACHAAGIFGKFFQTAGGLMGHPNAGQAIGRMADVAHGLYQQHQKRQRLN